MITMNNANATYITRCDNRKWAVDEEGIIRSTVIPAVPASVTVQVQIQVPETKPVETSEETAENKITMYNEDGSINIDIMNRLNEINKRKNRLVDELSSAEYVRKTMVEKGFLEAITNYVKYNGYKYDSKIMNYPEFISKINDYNAAITVIKTAKKEIEKIDKELEKYEF